MTTVQRDGFYSTHKEKAMKYYYCRVSTKDQNLDRQYEAAKRREVDKVFADKQSGKNLDRIEYQRMKRELQRGDHVYFLELSRLGRNLEDIKNEIRWYDEHGIMWHSEDIPTTMIDFQGQDWVGKMVNNLLIEVLGNIAEQERLKTLERQRGGIDAMPVIDGKRISRKTGRPMGRPELEISELSKFFAEQKSGLKTVDECCRELGISRATWYNKVKAV